MVRHSSAGPRDRWCEAGGHEARVVWWDGECDAAVQQRKQAEDAWKYQIRLHGTRAADAVQQAQAQLTTARRTAKRLLRMKEQRAREQRRDALLRCKDAKKFFRLLERYDHQETADGEVPLSVFQQHFEALAKPPECGWFDALHAARIKEQLAAWYPTGLGTAATLWQPERTLYNQKLITDYRLTNSEQKAAWHAAVRELDSDITLGELQECGQEMVEGCRGGRRAAGVLCATG